MITWSLDHLVTSKPLRGFTIAEILLSLTIIGVVAAITLPSLMANINERTWNIQRKALYARMSQAIAIMPQLNGYGEYEGTNTNGVVTVTTDTAAEAFLTEGLSKVLKINNICDATHLADCGIVNSFTDLGGAARVWPKKLSELNSKFTAGWDTTGYNSFIYNPQKDIDTKVAAFETQNGESIALYYNPSCINFSWVNHTYVQPSMCANFVYDLNGNKGPNAVGKDIGVITALYPNDSVVVAPMPLSGNAGTGNFVNAGPLCTAQDSESRMPNFEELMSVFYNGLFFALRGSSTYDNMWSSTYGKAGEVWVVNFNVGYGFSYNKTSLNLPIRCIKR